MTMTTAEVAGVPVAIAASLVAVSFTAIDPVAFTIAVGGVLAILFAGIANLLTIRNAKREIVAETAAVKKVAADVTAKIDAIAPVVSKIDAHVNSEKTRAEGENAAQKLQIDLQREMIEELKKAASLLAQAKATTDAANAIAQAAVAGATTPPIRAVAEQPLTGAPVSASLNNIDDSTKQIEKNTKRTDQAVQDLKDKP